MPTSPTRKRSRRRSSSAAILPTGSVRAFTLVELIVVMAILAVAVGVIVPRMGRSLSHRELTESAGMLAQTARTVRELAVARQEIFAININLDQQGYAVAVQSTDGDSTQMQPVRVSWLKPKRLPENVRIAEYLSGDGTTATSGTQELKFFPDGTSTGASMQLVSGQSVRYLMVAAHNGQVRSSDDKITSIAGDRYDFGD